MCLLVKPGSLKFGRSEDFIVKKDGLFLSEILSAFLHASELPSFRTLLTLNLKKQAETLFLRALKKYTLLWEEHLSSGKAEK